jgi:hypothetical protein
LILPTESFVGQTLTCSTGNTLSFVPNPIATNAIKGKFMRQIMFHGILLDLAFVDQEYPKSFSLFAQKLSGDWGLYGIKVDQNDCESTVVNIQAHMRTDQPFYNHLYDDERLIVIFRERIFRVTTHASSWEEVKQYGLTLGIPEQQLDFWPNRFQDEIHYFEQGNFMETTS